MPSRSIAKVTSTSAKTLTAGATSGSFTREWACQPARLFHLRNHSVAEIRRMRREGDSHPQHGIVLGRGPALISFIGGHFFEKCGGARRQANNVTRRQRRKSPITVSLLEG